MNDELRDRLKNLGAINARNIFTGLPVELIVPKSTQIVFVSDFFSTELTGGAELTTDAIIQKSPYNVFKVHSASVSPKFLDYNKNFYYIFGNFTQIPVESLVYLVNSNIKYSVIEYDYKFCMFRSLVLHKKQTNQDCNCSTTAHGNMIAEFYKKAKKLFWMSEQQKELFLSHLPILSDKENVVQGSTFNDETIENLLFLRLKHEQYMKQIPVKIWAVQSSNNWIKGTQETIKYCTEKKYMTRVLENMAYDKFLDELSKCYGFVFRPLDKDTAPRVVIEAKLIGLELDLNENVQIKNDAWFNSDIDSFVSHLRNQGTNFWNNIKL